MLCKSAGCGVASNYLFRRQLDASYEELSHNEGSHQNGYDTPINDPRQRYILFKSYWGKQTRGADDVIDAEYAGVDCPIVEVGEDVAEEE